MSKVRTRFAPSPTGRMHVGNGASGQARRERCLSGMRHAGRDEERCAAGAQEQAETGQIGEAAVGAFQTGSPF